MGTFMFSWQFAGRKAYYDWEIAEILKVFLDRTGRAYDDIAKFNISIVSAKTVHNFATFDISI